MEYTISKNIISYRHDNTTTNIGFPDDPLFTSRTNIILEVTAEYTLTANDNSVSGKFTHSLNTADVYLADYNFIEQTNITNDNLLAWIEALEEVSVTYNSFRKVLQKELENMSLTSDDGLVVL